MTSADGNTPDLSSSRDERMPAMARIQDLFAHTHSQQQEPESLGDHNDENGYKRCGNEDPRNHVNDHCRDSCQRRND